MSGYIDAIAEQINDNFSVAQEVRGIESADRNPLWADKDETARNRVRNAVEAALELRLIRPGPNLSAGLHEEIGRVFYENTVDHNGDWDTADVDLRNSLIEATVLAEARGFISS